MNLENYNKFMPLLYITANIRCAFGLGFAIFFSVKIIAFKVILFLKRIMFIFETVQGLGSNNVASPSERKTSYICGTLCARQSWPNHDIGNTFTHDIGNTSHENPDSIISIGGFQDAMEGDQCYGSKERIRTGCTKR